MTSSSASSEEKSEAPRLPKRGAFFLPQAWTSQDHFLLKAITRATSNMTTNQIAIRNRTSVKPSPPSSIHVTCASRELEA
jgi:hypothetical protein